MAWKALYWRDWHPLLRVLPEPSHEDVGS